LGPVYDGDYRQHERNLDEYADDRGEGCARLQSEEADGGCDRELEEVARPDERRRPGHAVRNTELSVEQVGQSRVQHDLDEDRYGQQGDDERLPEDGLALEGEQQDQRDQQGADRERAEPAGNALEVRRPLAQQVLSPELRQDDGHDDVEPDR